MDYKEKLEITCKRFKPGDVATYIGVTRSGLCKYRNGSRTPSEYKQGRIDELYKAAVAANKALGCD